MEIVEEAPEIYKEMDRFIEAADWVVMMLTGRETRNSLHCRIQTDVEQTRRVPLQGFLQGLASAFGKLH